MDQILAEETVDSGSDDLVQWTLTDHLNTVRDIAKYDPGTDMTTVVNHLVYDAFGRVSSQSNPAVDSLFLFTARPFDPDTGLQNNLNRWYDPAVGRWLSEDRLEADISVYRYCANNPLLYTDPTGRDWLDCMAECIKDNDPLPYALGAAAKVILLTGGWQSKTVLAEVAKMLGDERLAAAILRSLNNPGAVPVSDIPSFIVAAKHAGHTKAGQAFRMLGGKAAAILGPIEVAYGLALAAVEIHCAGWCCTAWWYGIPYSHADGNVIDAWKNTYFDL